MDESAIIGLLLAGWFCVLALAEFISARRGLRADRSSDARLLTNFGLGALVLGCNSLLPLARISASALTEANGFGVAPSLGLPVAAALAAFLMLDSFATYWTHRLMHAVPLLWRIHRVHHSDGPVDVSTSLPIHPLELLVTLPTSAAVILIVGAPTMVVVVAQALSAAAAMWQHADLDLRPGPDRALSLFLVTPGFHRVHHSPERCLHDGNYGELITAWDWLFGTSKPRGGRGRVGLDRQVARPDALMAQIWSPVYAP